MEQQHSPQSPRSMVDKIRSITSSAYGTDHLFYMEFVNCRKLALQGDFYMILSAATWTNLTRKLLVSVSSTFTDTKLERNHLMDDLFLNGENRCGVMVSR